MEPVTDQQTTTPNHDLFKGCIFGALCGDAIGAYLEFKAIITPKDVEKAFTLPGGGAHKVGKGQVTDDSELLLCLGHGLSEGKGVLDLDKIAAWYGNWVKSRPFDMGATTRNALPKAVDMKAHQARLVRLGASKSQTSQSNGALMRIMPMCLWAHKLSRDDLIRAVSEETKLTHPNQTAIDVSVAYVYTIQYLFNHRGDYQGAYKACKEIAEHLKNPELLSWIEEMERGELTIVHKASGWVKHAFCYALHYLKNNTGYGEALKDIMSRKGDTDTNACIIGGMLGALHGVSGVPQKAIERVLKFDPTKESGIKRPDFLVPGKCVNRIIEEILKCAPSKLEMVGAETEEEKARL